MVAVVLNKLWVNLVSTGEGISGASNRGKTYTAERSLDRREFANGRMRLIGAKGIKRDLPYALVAVSLPTKDHLEDWIGQLVQVRDIRSQKWFGGFAGVTVSEYMRPDLYAVSFTLLEATYAEGV